MQRRDAQHSTRYAAKRAPSHSRGNAARCAPCLGALMLAALSPAALAQQDYPNRPIRYISPYAAGGSTSVTARLIGQQLTEAWGQQVVVDNRPGANTIIGTQIAVNAPPDGYTLVSIGAVLASNHTLVKTPYDALKDIAPIATALTYESVLVVPPTLPVKSVKELVALAKSRPGRLTYGTSSHGGPTHLLAEMFNKEAGVKTLQVPYKGGGPAVSDLMGAHIDIFFSNPANVASLVHGGRLRPLAVTGKQRMDTFPDTPTFIEAGMPGMLLTNWQGVGGPARIPATIIDRISAEIKKLTAKPQTRQVMSKIGFEPFYNDPAQTAALLRTDVEKYAKIIREANIEMPR
ncbi:MAG: tripartite tricarboxylate transporter substrate binding protein [Betaproteobacteria bacterium]|nr:tripartite tricarboxylate transporter substrate binding protein [Betaproteobacteria bacterium]